ncbi:lipoprotein [Mesoplasma photuris]|uniref:lipoprotein n=1 Tax=Mesoplasma photuris TaxID=217731 RepID=UPI0004E21A1A|nr:lipoprotein [Mesoplasma photuris]
MKKILAILGAITLTTTASSVVVSCGDAKTIEKKYHDVTSIKSDSFRPNLTNGNVKLDSLTGHTDWIKGNIANSFGKNSQKAWDDLQTAEIVFEYKPFAEWTYLDESKVTGDQPVEIRMYIKNATSRSESIKFEWIKTPDLATVVEPGKIDLSWSNGPDHKEFLIETHEEIGKLQKNMAHVGGWQEASDEERINFLKYNYSYSSSFIKSLSRSLSEMVLNNYGFTDEIFTSPNFEYKYLNQQLEDNFYKNDNNFKQLFKLWTNPNEIGDFIFDFGTANGKPVTLTFTK